MPPDYRILLWTVALTIIEVLVAVVAVHAQVGLGVLAGNRDGLPPLVGFAGRAQRAHWNMLENLPLFIALVFIAVTTGKFSATTFFGCQLFFWGRLAHWVIYLIGIPWLRTIAWLVSVVGLIVIFCHLW
jgi:uncharacterized MAPEG superfamily protein